MSDGFGWRTIPKHLKVCRACRRPITRVVDVFEHRVDYPSNKLTFLCQDCRHARSETLQAETRQRLVGEVSS